VTRIAPVAGFRSQATATPYAACTFPGVSTSSGRPCAATVPPDSRTIRSPYSAHSDRSCEATSAAIPHASFSCVTIS